MYNYEIPVDLVQQIAIDFLEEERKVLELIKGSTEDKETIEECEEQINAILVLLMQYHPDYIDPYPDLYPFAEEL